MRTSNYVLCWMLTARTPGVTEQAQLAHALATFKGSRKELTQALGLSERTLYRRMQALGIKV